MQIKAVERLGDIQIRIRIEAVHEALAFGVAIAFDLEFDVEVSRRVAALARRLPPGAAKF